MKVQNNTNMKSYIMDYRFDNEEIRLKIKAKLGTVLEYRRGKYVVVLKSQTTKEEMKLEVKSVDLTGGEFGILVGLKVSKYIEIFNNQIVDVYVLDMENKIESRVSAKKIKKTIKPYYNSESKKFIQLYKSDKGYLSICESTGGRDIFVKSATVSNSGVLTVKGVLNCAKLHSIGKSVSLKKVRVRSKQNEKVIEADVTTFAIDELVKNMKYTGIDYSGCGFSFDLNLLESGLSGRTVNGKIYLVLGEEEIEVKLRQPKVKVSGVKVVNINGKPVWLLRMTGRKNIKFTLEDISKDIEFRELYVNKGELEVVIKKGLNNIDLSNKKKIEMVLKSESRAQEYCVKCRVIINDVIRITAFFDEFASRKNIALDTYGIYLKINNENRKIVSRKDEIMNKGEIVRFPKMHLIDKKKNALSIEPYYTDKNSISIKVEKMMEVEEIESVKVDSKGICIDGKMYVRKPLEDAQNEFSGKLSLIVYYGVKIELPYVAKIECIEGDKIQHRFKIHIPKEEIKLRKYDINYIVRSMSNRVVFCYAESTPEKRNFVLNIKAEDIKVTIEDRIKDRSIGCNIVNSISKPMYSVFNKLLPMNNKLVVFQSYYGKSYSCNPKAIYEEMLNMNEKYKCVWVLEDVYRDLPGVPKIVKPGSLSYYYYMARAKYFVSNTSSPEFYKKRKGAVNIETWHGTPLKKLGVDIKKGYRAYRCEEDRRILSNSKTWDALIVPNKHTGETLKRAYSYENEILEVGYPRNDIFYKNPQKRTNEVRKKLNISEGKKIIMYAPTFREGEVGTYKMPFSVDKFNDVLGKEYVLLLRLHYKDANRLDDLTYSENVKNVSLYDDISELYLVSDILITDYSSAMFDYANSKKPMLFYAYDLDDYEERLRGLYFDFKDLAPGPLVKNEKELFDAIKEIDKISVEYKEKYDKFTEEFCSMEDGEASRRVIEKVFKKEKAEN